ncbi:formyltransferase family protein [Dethiosulfatarculus sandiegensis]|uniref:phosphoribosylglycinamide formyltransferase 1 n=1 Tax=Dethiosulfatarculus sandiegensis TaxID=1429043 RepID=A0A0D2GIC4_9BACT|nr:formyltransferase family protein [Dethiosulfatarculus sandiegensis]KIX14567.1 formyl transferase [Dethiosulfatarculus sandiegensis]
MGLSQNPASDKGAGEQGLRVAAFMSGSGSNIRRLLERKSPFYHIKFIFSDRADGACQGEKIAHEYGLPYFSFDIRRFHEIRGLKRSLAHPEGLKARHEYDQVAKALLKAFEIDVIALGGYMSFTTLTGGINVHPADLSLVSESGERRFVGDDAVLDAIKAGQTELRSSTLWIDQGVDSGPLLMVSDPLPVKLPCPLAELLQNPPKLRRVADEHQEELKKAGDWVVLPLTLELMGQGRLQIGQDNLVYFDGLPKPEGVRPSEIQQNVEKG